MRDVTVRCVLAGAHGATLAGLRDALESYGFEVVGETRDGAQVLPLVEHRAPEVVILDDLQLPGIDGLGCLKRLRSQHPEIKIFICAASASPDHIHDVFDRGAHGYVLRSINPVDVGSAIRQAVEGTAYVTVVNPALSHETGAATAALPPQEL